MTRRVALLILLLATVAPQVRAQRPVSATADGFSGTEFDFLIGRWTVTGTPRVSALVARFHGVPQLTGTWQAARGPDGRVIQDDLRATDATGRAWVAKHASRTYDVSSKLWKVNEGSTTDTAPTRVQRHAADIVVTTEGRTRQGDRVLIRRRFSEMRPASFRYTQDRSEDEGQTWEAPDFVLLVNRQPGSASH